MTSSTGDGTIRIGLIGLGSWPRQSYVSILAEEPGVEVRAVAARTSATRQVARELFGPSVELHGNYRDLLERSQVDTVMIGLPPRLSARAATAAVEADMHVWVEPPFVGDDDTTRMLVTASNRKKVFHADLELRYLPAVTALREMASGGGLGEVLRVRVELENDWATKSGWEEPTEGSLVYTLGPWYIDLIDAFLGKVPERAIVVATHRGDSGAVEVGTASLEFPGGVLGKLALDLRSSPQLQLRLKVVGSDGEAEADLINGKHRHRRAGGEWVSGVADCVRPVRGFVGAWESVRAFLSAIRDEGKTESGPAEYRRLQAALLALLKSEQEGLEVRLESG